MIFNFAQSPPKVNFLNRNDNIEKRRWNEEIRVVNGNEIFHVQLDESTLFFPRRITREFSIFRSLGYF